MKAKVYVKPSRTCSINTESTAMSPALHHESVHLRGIFQIGTSKYRVLKLGHGL